MTHDMAAVSSDICDDEIWKSTCLLHYIHHVCCEKLTKWGQQNEEGGNWDNGAQCSHRCLFGLRGEARAEYIILGKFSWNEQEREYGPFPPLACSSISPSHMSDSSRVSLWSLPAVIAQVTSPDSPSLLDSPKQLDLFLCICIYFTLAFLYYMY